MALEVYAHILHGPAVRTTSFKILGLLAASAAFVHCSQSAPAPQPPPVASSAPAPEPPPSPQVAPPDEKALLVDPVAVGMTPAGITKLCDDNLALAEKYLASVRSLSSDGKVDPRRELSWDNTMALFDRAELAVAHAANFTELMGAAHPDKAVQEAAKKCQPKVEKLITGIYLDKDLAAVVQAYGDKGDKLTEERARYLKHTARDFRRNGLSLPPEKQAQLRKLNEKITEISQKFESNIANSKGFIEVSPRSLRGMPKPFKKSHPRQKNGKIKLTTDYPDYYPFVTYSEDRKAALELTRKFQNRGMPNNVKLLEQLLDLRKDKAALLGYATWADFKLETRMAKSAKKVDGFLQSVRKHLETAGKTELAEMRKVMRRRGKPLKGDLQPSDRLYLIDQLRKAKYGLDSKKVSEYFEVMNVRQGILDITSKMYGLKYKKLGSATWHKDVEAFEIQDSAGKPLGRFYFDLYPREGKYKHAAVFGIRSSAKLPKSGRLMPIAAIVCNFPKPGKAPALMTHQQVTTFFHEFGHVLHQLLTQAELAAFSGTSVARDFVESPSQMFEEWAWNKKTLALFAKHYKTGKPFPDKLHDKLTKSRGVGRAINTQRQLYLAALDQAYHTRPKGLNTTKVIAEVHNSYTQFKYIPGTHFQAAFGHLVGYDAGYYGYQWALSISRDLLTRFAKDGLLNTATAAAYRKEILERGGSRDEAAMVEAFLGRPPSDAAYKSFLSGK